MVHRVLKDDSYDNMLRQEGYTVVPFLNEQEVEVLKGLFFNSHPVSKEGLYATAHSDNFDFKKKLNDGILHEFGRALEQTFFECHPLGGSYIVKYKGDKGVLFPHQDWNIVDEEFFRSFNIWVPLVDTNETNGAISVLPRSHKIIKSYRGVNIPDPFYKSNSYAWKFHETLNMKAGEALIYDHALLHASAINQTDEPRIAVVFGIISEKAEMRYYYMENGKVAEYESSVEFFFRNDILKGPSGLKKIKDIDYNFPVVSEEQFDEIYFGTRTKANQTGTSNAGKNDKSIFRRILEAVGI